MVPPALLGFTSAWEARNSLYCAQIIRAELLFVWRVETFPGGWRTGRAGGSCGECENGDYFIKLIVPQSTTTDSETAQSPPKPWKFKSKSKFCLGNLRFVAWEGMLGWEFGVVPLFAWKKLENHCRMVCHYFI